MSNNIEVTENLIEGVLSYNSEVLLNYKIGFPRFESADYRMCIEKINWFYKHKALEYKKYVENTLFDMAIQQYLVAISNAYPFHAFDVVQTYNVTYANDCILSLYYDTYQYLGGAHGTTTRHSETWNLKRCRPIKIEQLIRCPQNYRSYLFTQFEEEIKTHPEDYFENYTELLRVNFNKNSFYNTTEGLVFYYGQYDIAPYASGIREFFIPYDNCVLDPLRIC